MSSQSDSEIYRSVIKDPKMWLYIFENERPDFDNSRAYYKYINNTVNLAFFYSFSCIREMYNVIEDIEEKKRKFNPNARRAIKNIDRIYNGIEVNYELINYILLDIQFDLALGAESCLKEYIPGISPEFNVMDYTPRILHWMSSAKTESSQSIDDLIKLFQRLLKSLPFIRDTKIVGDGEDVCFETLVGFEAREVYTDYKLYVLDCGRNYYQMYFLERVDMRKDSLTLVYSTPNYADRLLLVFCNGVPSLEDNEGMMYRESTPEDMEMIYSRITGVDPQSFSPPEELSTDGIKNIYTVNYKYIKNLSLSISDEIGKNDNTMIRDQILRKYGYDPYEDIDLDNVIIMQLIEKTPSEVLFDLFCLDRGAFHGVIKNLYNRFNRKIDFNYIDFSKVPIDYSNLDRYLDGCLKTKHGTLHDLELAELQANYVLSMLLENSNGKKARVNRIHDVLETVNSDVGVETAQKSCVDVLERLYCFYSGIIAYGQVKKEYDTAVYNSILSDEVIKETQEKLREAFTEAAQKEYHDRFWNKRDDDPEKRLAFAIESFIELISKAENSAETKKLLKCVLGRSSIVDNRLLGLSPQIVSLEAKEQKARILRILEYLTTGSFEKNESKGDFNSSIYPIVGKYISNRESNDQCRVAHFSIRIDVDINGRADYMKSINILSEFSYRIDEYYYCLPNISRSNMDWWIDPLIVNADEFNSIFNVKE